MQPNVEALTHIGDFAKIIECPQNRCACRCVHKKWLSIFFERLFDAFNQIVDAHASICVAFHTYQIVCADAQPVNRLLDAVMRFLGRKCNQRPLAKTATRFDIGRSTISGQYHSIPGGKSQNCVSTDNQFYSKSLELLNVHHLHVGYRATRCEYAVAIIKSKQIAKRLYHFVFHQCEYGPHFKCVSVSSREVDDKR